MPAKKSNTGLNRIFRKNTSNKLSIRDWDAPQSADALNIEKNFGVSSKALKEAVAQLTAEEVIRSDGGLEPLSNDQQALAKRMEKFGTNAPATATAEAPVVSAEVLNQRAARFGTTVVAPSGATAIIPSVLASDDALSKRAARFGVPAPVAAVSAEELTDAMRKRLQRFEKPTAPAAPALQLTEEEREAMERRAKRFAA